MSDTPSGESPQRAVDRTAEDFDAMYTGTPPWDIGRPQPAFVELADRGAISGRVLDAGCGTGEHTLMLAARGLDATGIDAAPTAIAVAEHKAVERGLTARFLVFDALHLGDLGEQFDTVVDCGLFHVFDDARRASYVDALAAVTAPSARYLMLCFSDKQPGDWGPRRVTREEIRDAFRSGWTVESVIESEIQTNLDPPRAEAWLATISRH